jgi:carboxypeptidase family protein
MRFRTGLRCTFLALFLLLAAGFPARSFAQSAAGTLRGTVTDPSGGAVPGASVVVTAAGGEIVTVTTNRDGTYEVKNLAPGTYDVQVLAKGFAIFESKQVTITANQIQKLDVPLAIEEQQQKVVVEGESPAVDVNPENNIGAIVLKGEDLKELSDDPDELQSDLEALAGPSAGPNGGQIYIDGFTAGQLPPKSAIREIRINQNPFSSEYDKLGYGRIEIFTKPGTDQWHGSAQLQGNDSAFNSKNPFAHHGEPGYDSVLFNGNVGGPLSKKASFFFSGQYRDINDVAVIDAETLNSSFVPTPFNASVPEPRTRLNLGPRVDYQLTKNNTLSVRYQYYRDNEDNQGLTGFALPSQAYNVLNTEQTVQISDTQVFGTNLVNETHFQYLRDGENQIASSSLPTVIVPTSFTGGGNNGQNVLGLTNHYELQNYTQWVRGNHTVKFGVRLRQTSDSNSSLAGFNGNYVFSSLPAFEVTEQGLAAGLPFSQIQAEGGGPLQLSITTPITGALTHISTFDSGWYVQDDWRVRPNITISGGLRLEQQTDISDHLDWEPRVALAWGIGHGKTAPKTVLRVGSGLFYDRFTENLVLQAERLNGITQEQFVVQSPCFFNPNSVPSIPTIEAMCPNSTVLPTTYRISPRLHAPGILQTAVTLERQVNKSASVSVSYLNSRGFDQLLTNNINTPLLGTFPANPVFPLGTAGNVYEFESEAIFRQNQLITQVNYHFKTRVSLRGYYVLNYANSDTAGPTSFPSNPFNLLEDYGRASFDIRQRVFVGGSINMPHGISLYPFLLATSGAPYSITISQDLIGSSQFNQRPAFASAQSNLADVAMTKFGNFDTLPQPGETIVPINSLTGPPHFSLNLRLSKTWGFGGESSHAGGGDQGGGPGGGGRGPGGGGGGGGSRGGFGIQGGGFGGGGTNQRYNLTLSVSARNIFNYENVALPSGVLIPPDTPGGTASESGFFGKSNALAGGAFSSTSASRLIYLQLGFTF